MQHLGFVHAACLASALTLATSCGENAPSTKSETKELASRVICDRTPIPQLGMLRACAAGTPSAAGPGVPDGFIAPTSGSPTLSSEEAAAATDAAKLDALRNPPGVDPADLGFGRPPARPQAASPSGGAQ